MRGYLATEQLLLFCDFHGHSRKRNIFAYACEVHGVAMPRLASLFAALLCRWNTSVATHRHCAAPLDSKNASSNIYEADISGQVTDVPGLQINGERAKDEGNIAVPQVR